MINIDILGFVATFCTTGSILPQIIKVFKTKNVSDISLSMYIMYFIGILFWIVYAFSLNSVPIHISNFFGFVFSLSMIIMKLKYRK